MKLFFFLPELNSMMRALSRQFTVKKKCPQTYCHQNLLATAFNECENIIFISFIPHEERFRTRQTYVTFVNAQMKKSDRSVQQQLYAQLIGCKEAHPLFRKTAFLGNVTPRGRWDSSNYCI